MQHAMQCFAEYGYGATTNRLIATRAGVTPAAVHHHFDQKKKLMFAIHQEVAERFLLRLGEASREGPNYLARIHGVLTTLHDIIASDRDVVAFGLVAREEARRFDELRGLTGESDARFAQLFSDILGDAVRAEQLSRRDESTLAAALSVVSLGLAAVAVDMDVPTHRRVTEMCCRLFTSFAEERDSMGGRR